MKKLTHFSSCWNEIENPATHPARGGKVCLMEYEELSRRILEKDRIFAENLVKSLYDGDAYIIKRVFSEAFLRDIQKKVHLYWSKRNSSFHKMLEGVPNFTRIIDYETGKNYYAHPVKHSAYFFPWNQDPLNLFPTCYPAWRVMKIIAGLDEDEYEKNTPKDGIIDRIQVVRYPTGGGKIDSHSDPYLTQKIVTSLYMSKRGVDYLEGGCYIVNHNNCRVDMEDLIDVGDMSFIFPSVAHGVAPVDPTIPTTWDSLNGRWWIGMFSNMSDEVKDRHTGKAIPLPPPTGDTTVARATAVSCGF